MATIRIDVELDEFDLDEILEELEDRCNYNNSNRKQLIDWFRKYLKEIHIENNISIIHQQKIQFLTENLEKISLIDLENLVK